MLLIGAAAVGDSGALFMTIVVVLLVLFLLINWFRRGR